MIEEDLIEEDKGATARHGQSALRHWYTDQEDRQVSVCRVCSQMWVVNSGVGGEWGLGRRMSME